MDIYSIITIILGSSVVNGIINHFLYNNKLKKESKMKKNDTLSQKILEGLYSVRDAELELLGKEIYDVENEVDERGCRVDMFGDECVYPAIFNDIETYHAFLGKIKECRRIHEKNLSCEIALQLMFIEQYLAQLSLFMAENGGEENLQIWGTLFIFDLRMWQRKMDKLLVKEINKYSYKLESHQTKKWKFLWVRIVQNQFKKTILYFLLTGKCRKRDFVKMQTIEEGLQNIFKENDSEN